MGQRTCCCPDTKEVGKNRTVCYSWSPLFRDTTALGYRARCVSLYLCFCNSTVLGNPSRCIPRAGVFVSLSLQVVLLLSGTLWTPALIWEAYPCHEGKPFSLVTCTNGTSDFVSPHVRIVLSQTWKPTVGSHCWTAEGAGWPSLTGQTWTLHMPEVAWAHFEQMEKWGMLSWHEGTPWTLFKCLPGRW